MALNVLQYHNVNGTIFSNDFGLVANYLLELSIIGALSIELEVPDQRHMQS